MNQVLTVMENNEGTGWEKDKSQRKKTVGKKKAAVT